MVWNSMTLMTVFDLFIIGVVIYANYIYLQRIDSIKQIGAKLSAQLLLLGLDAIGFFYLADLATIYILPLFMPMMEAMSWMKALHLNAMWFVMTASSVMLVMGVAHLLYTVFPRQITAVSELENRQKLAERSVQVKDEFFASMNHELRTPLTSIIGNAEILSESQLTSDQKVLLESVKVSGRSLLSLVNDILDLSKMEAGKFEIDRSPFDLSQMLRDVEMIFSSKARNSKLHFEIKREVSPRNQIWGDGKRVQQILINLLSNAFKFTDQGSVVLTISLDETLNLTVEDTGIGMSEESIERLFQPYKQADSTISLRFGGTGLGVHICKQLAEQMAGTIEVSSSEGKGSCFKLKLPYDESDLLVERLQQDNSSVSIQKRFIGNVLIAEDTPELQILASRMVESLGAQVEVAKNGKVKLPPILGQQLKTIFCA